MEEDFDPNKDAINRRKHGLSLADWSQLDLDQALILPDDRKDYGEDRYRAFGLIDGRLHVLVFTVRHSQVRPISFRKGNKTEEKRYGK